MINDQTIDRKISKVIIAGNEKEKEKHISSGKLSAGMLGQPLQWQILKTIGVPQKELDEYVLRKFQRGKDVEEWLLGYMDGIVDKQKFVEYKNTIGYIDAIVDMKDYEFKVGVIPHEIKSVSNAKFRRIVKVDGADHQHLLQATLYAMATKSEKFAIDYVSTDDYRIKTYIYDTKDYSDEVEKEIKEFYDCLKAKRIPTFEPKLAWQSKPDYNNYPDFMKLNEQEILNKIKSEYLEVWKGLK